MPDARPGKGRVGGGGGGGGGGADRFASEWSTNEEVFEDSVAREE